MMPGVPDFYQGTEFWELSLVDPDNRRLPDFEARCSALRRIDAAPRWAAMTADWENGDLKLAWTRELLALRNALPHVFLQGDYRPLDMRGRDRDNIIAFSRTSGADTVVVAIGRHFASLTGGRSRWPQSTDIDAELALGMSGGAGWRAIGDPDLTVTGHTVPTSSLFTHFPAAVLVGRAARPAGRKARNVRAPV